MTCVAAIDSGGTHTNMRIVDSTSGAVVSMAFESSLASNRLDRELRELLAILFSAICTNDVGQPAAIWISTAGYAEPTRVRFERLLRESLGSYDGQLGVCNDAATLLLANDPDLVIVVAGTGSGAIARSQAGEVIVRGGDEWVVADHGSAFWLGLDGIRAAYNAHQGGAKTALLASLVDHYRSFYSIEEGDLSATISEIARNLAGAGTNTKPVIANFAPRVTHQAALGDELAREIVRRSVDELAGAAVTVYRQLVTHERDRDVFPRFLVNGSVAYHSSFYSEVLTASLDQLLFDVRENLKCKVAVDFQLNGLENALLLADRLAAGEPIEQLDRYHPYSLLGPR